MIRYGDIPFHGFVVRFARFAEAVTVGVFFDVFHLFQDDIAKPTAVIPFQPVDRFDMFQSEHVRSVRHVFFERIILFQPLFVILAHDAF